MKISPPLEITPSLEPGFRMAGAWVSISYAPRSSDVHLPQCRGRTRYRWRIILPDGTEHTMDDLQSGGIQNPGLQYGLENFLTFLGAAVEHYRYHKQEWKSVCREDETFPHPVVEWADTCIDDLDMMRLNLEENKILILET